MLESTKDELDVANTLLQLPTLVRESDRRTGVLRWGAKRPRTLPPDDPPPPPPPPPPRLRRRVRDREAEPRIKPEAESKKRRTGAAPPIDSPASTLSFPRSADDDSTAPPSPTKRRPTTTNKAEKRLDENEMRRRIATLSAEKETLKRSLSEAKIDIERFKARNYQLRVLKITLAREEGQRPNSSDTASVDPTSPPSPPPVSAQHHRRPAALPDLNAIPEAAQEYEHEGAPAPAAEARKRFEAWTPPRFR